MTNFLWVAKRLALLFILLNSQVNAQIYNPVAWETKVEQTGNTATLFINATIEESWHLYATKLPSEDGPIATEVRFIENEAFKTKGNLVESKYETMFDPIFEMDVSFHSNTASFSQEIEITSISDFKALATIYYMVCDDKRCLPPEEIEFSFDIKGAEQTKVGAEQTEVAVVSDISTQIPQEESQIFDPVDWTYTVEKHDDNTYSLIFNAEIEDKWHVYSQHLPNDDGPVATEFFFNETAGVKLDGEVREGEYHTEFDPNFDMDLNFFDGKAEFRQIIKVENDENKVITGEFVYMTCDDKRCLPPEYIEYS